MNNNLVRIIAYEQSNSFYYRLINNNIYFKDLIKTKDYYILTINIDEFNRLNKRYKCKIIRYYGINFIIDILNKHRYMFISLMISLLLLYLLSNTIFNISINSSDNNIIKILNKSLEDNDISIYKRKKNYNELEKIKGKILDDNRDKLEWLEIKSKGCNYVVDVTPRIKKEIELSSEDFTNIVASKDGKILFITSNSGTILKDRNDYVKKGEVLISGKIYKDDKVIYKVKSEGKVYAEVWYTVKVTIPYDYVEYTEYDKAINRYYLDIFGNEFTILGKYNGTNVMKEKQLIIDKPYLPFKLYKETIKKYKYNKYYLTEQEAYNEALKRSDNNIQKMLNDDEYIISKKVLKKETFSSKIKIEVFYKVYENIGIASKIIEEE